ncbi:TetR family transcriptional regulator, partial [Streptomyces sp. SID6013]|nr:TetR family transcriptional regulator [Streptomyces sp. SID6013]
MSAAPVGTREIGRHAVRAELARVAFNRFCLTGFNQVTFADLAEAAGVSRSTFLRYFGTKEDVVLFVFDPVGDVIADALDAERADEDDWSRLRGALESAATFLVRDVQHLATIL